MKKIINYIVIIISILMVFFGLLIDLQPEINMSGAEKILIYVTPMILLFVNMIIQIKNTKKDVEKEKIKKQILGLIFIIYMISLSTLLFLGSSYRHAGQFLTLEFDLNKINIIPFKEIVSFISGLFNGNNLKVVLINIGGNLLAFAPMGFFIPILFWNKVKNLKQFTLLIIIIIFIVELTQFVTNTGIADIDDLILNTLGAVIVYVLMQTKMAKDILVKLFK